MYTMTINPQFNSLEISFDGKPSEQIRQALKDLKFRWHNVKKVWYGYASEEETRAALEGKKIEAPKAERKAPAFDKEMLRSEFSKVWKDKKMIDYCTNEVASYAVLPSGEIVTVDKQRIETRFCFGESGYDYDDAIKAAQHARESVEYFKSENMESFNSKIKNLEEALNGDSRYMVAICGRYRKDCKLRSAVLENITDILDACGGSANLEELKGQTVRVPGFGDRRIATDEEIQLIIDAYKTAAAAHEKKVDAYLKRYGTSKVHSWTYWRDA